MTTSTMRLAALLLVAPVTVTLAACSSGGGGAATTTPATPSRTSTPPPAPNLSVAQANAVLTDYDRRNNAAIKKAASYDPSGWASADTGVLLASDRRQTAIAKALTRKEPPVALRSTATAAYGGVGPTDTQGTWALIVGKQTMTNPTPSSSASSSPAGREYLTLQPGQSTAGWTAFGSVWSPADAPALPKPVTTAPAPLTAPQRQTMANAVSNAAYAVSNGGTSDFGYAAVIKQIRAFGWGDSVAQKDRAAANSNYQCAGWGDAKRTPATTATLLGTPAVRTLRAQGATLGLVSLDCDQTLTAPDGQRITLDPRIATVDGVKLPTGREVTLRAAVQLLLVVPDQGKPAIVAGRVGYVLPRGAD
ncbi:hypothetical protein G9U51_09005 [Calidifontibacter sp. DB0510]|uniref:Lipoprotein n=1 Tax=Metallococcus carri TaxID=1656884 RepID=A0A967AZD9_9MICO|nr:hypothetical protein [Metallococcus carri]NHN55911.1 hypothetical protein [Metallococcus carri]NOP38401.1 hypothetical protein [Calidifontibacter sp. DB2511S]